VNAQFARPPDQAETSAATSFLWRRAQDEAAKLANIRPGQNSNKSPIQVRQRTPPRPKSWKRINSLCGRSSSATLGRSLLGAQTHRLAGHHRAHKRESRFGQSLVPYSARSPRLALAWGQRIVSASLARLRGLEVGWPNQLGGPNLWPTASAKTLPADPPPTCTPTLGRVRAIERTIERLIPGAGLTEAPAQIA